MKIRIRSLAIILLLALENPGCLRVPCHYGDPLCNASAAGTALLVLLPGNLGGGALGILKTGQTYCSDTAGTSFPCPLLNYPYEDGEIQQGLERQFLLTGDGNVLQKSTGLIWQRCSQGYSGEDCSIVGAQTTFTVAQANASCTSLGTDWRLPSIQELSTLMDSGRSSPSYDGTAFPGSSFAVPYWSATADAGSPGSNFQLNFGLGVLISVADTNSNAARCVQGPTAPTRSFADSGTYSVTDSVTGLVWQKCPRGYLTLPGCSLDGGATGSAWQEALQYCGALLLDGRVWRLPNRNELMSLLDYSTASNPRIDSVAFPGGITGNFWSSTTVTGSTSQVWTVDYASAIVALNGKAGTGPLIRCVSGP
ncbi:MAG: DUF1566 domain-containing protein [Leptospiraceae bacterium]|nr:DUF1566 domain-containing protein [Leptospiraceae bacterium]